VVYANVTESKTAISSKLFFVLVFSNTHSHGRRVR